MSEWIGHLVGAIGVLFALLALSIPVLIFRSDRALSTLDWIMILSLSMLLFAKFAYSIAPTRKLVK